MLTTTPTRWSITSLYKTLIPADTFCYNTLVNGFWSASTGIKWQWVRFWVEEVSYDIFVQAQQPIILVDIFLPYRQVNENLVFRLAVWKMLILKQKFLLGSNPGSDKNFFSLKLTYYSQFSSHIKCYIKDKWGHKSSCCKCRRDNLDSRWQVDIRTSRTVLFGLDGNQ